MSCCIALSLAGCGGGGSGGGATPGGGGSGGSGTSSYDLITTSVTSGATPDAAIGDTSTFIFTGAPPTTTRIADPIVTHFAADAANGQFTLINDQGGTFVLSLTGATTATTTETDPVFDPATGAQTGSNAYATTDIIATYSAPPATGVFTATVTAVTAPGPSGTTVGDIFRVLITPSCLISVGDGDFTWVALAKSGPQWYAQASFWDPVASAVETTKLIINSDGLSGSFLDQTGSTTNASYTFSIAPLTLPATITGARTDIAGNAVSGSAPGYTSTAYVLGQHPADAAVAISVDAHAGTMTIAGVTYQLNAVIDDGSNKVLAATRFFTDSSLTTSDKRAWEAVSVETTDAGGFVGGHCDLSLWADPTPTNNGGSSGNDTSLGSIGLVP